MKIKGIFDQVKEKNILIIGDSMIDSYIIGKIERVSPEAPVPIVNVKKKNIKLGGAANVALNIKSLGMNPILCSVIGNDSGGDSFIKLCDKNKIDASGIIRDNSRKTIIKERIIVEKKHILRIDREQTFSINNEIKNKLLIKVKEKLKNSEIVILQDYDKGVIDSDLFIKIKKLKKNIFISVDPKERNFFNYKGVNLFKPNLKEILSAFSSKNKSLKNLTKLSEKIVTRNNIKNIMITLSDNGLMIYKENRIDHFKIKKKKIVDVSGAGDTVISLATILFYLNINIKFIGEICNLAGGMACMSSGVNAIDLKELIKNAERNNLDLYL